MPLRIRDLTVIHARIPLRTRVRHASHTREANDTLLVRCRLSDGTAGWGEGLPRPYVTGETISTCWDHLQGLNHRELAVPIENADQPGAMLDAIRFPRPDDQRECFGNAARCALELAILDAVGRAWNQSMAEMIRNWPEAQPLVQRADEVRYSAVITSSSIRKAAMRAALFRATGFQQCKVKVGLGRAEDQKLLSLVRKIMGRSVRLRVDANEAWQPEAVAAEVRSWDPLGIESLEQPVPHDRVDALSEVRQQISIPIMLDESLCSREDALRAIDGQWCDAFNIRISKCGGIRNSVRLALLAHEHGLTAQLGCQVGETGILSAAGRHLASAITGWTAVEGSFDRFLVREPLTQEDLTFGWQGRGPALAGSGLGITIEDDAIERVTVRSETYSVE